MLPAIPYGTDTNQLAFPLAINLNPSTLTQVIRDIVDSLAVHSIVKLLILNSHGGNDFKPVLRELYGKTPVRLFLCDWYRMAADVEKADLLRQATITPAKSKPRWRWPIFPTSSPAIRRPAAWRPTTAQSNRTRFDAVNRGWISITRPWHLLTTNSGRATRTRRRRKRARALMDILVERIAGFLVELAAAEIDEQFPF